MSVGSGRHRGQETTPGSTRVQAVEESGDLVWDAQDVGNRAALVVALPSLLELWGDDVGAVVDGQVAARWQGVHEAVHDRTRLAGVGDVSQDAATAVLFSSNGQ
jgi:hypothetical protein